VANALTGIPVLNCIGWLVPFLLGIAGLGAVIMSRFGTQTVVAPAAIAPALLAPISPAATPVPPLTPISPNAPETDASQPKPRAKKVG
jgi:hypothetical protein